LGLLPETVFLYSEFSEQNTKEADMQRSSQKTYTRKRPAHPDTAHTKAKGWFKRKGRKSVRKFEKQQTREQHE
jgi:hypothetical protein